MYVLILIDIIIINLFYNIVNDIRYIYLNLYFILNSKSVGRLFKQGERNLRPI